MFDHEGAAVSLVIAAPAREICNILAEVPPGNRPEDKEIGTRLSLEKIEHLMTKQSNSCLG